MVSFMNQILDALFSPSHAVLAFIVVWGGTAIMAGSAMGFWQPDYQRLLMVIVLAYWVTVVCQAGLFGRRRDRS